MLERESKEKEPGVGTEEGLDGGLVSHPRRLHKLGAQSERAVNTHTHTHTLTLTHTHSLTHTRETDTANVCPAVECGSTH